MVKPTTKVSFRIIIFNHNYDNLSCRIWLIIIFLIYFFLIKKTVLVHSSDSGTDFIWVEAVGGAVPTGAIQGKAFLSHNNFATF